MKKTYESWDAHLIDCQLKGKQDLSTLSSEKLKAELNNNGFTKAKILYCMSSDFNLMTNNIDSLNEFSRYLLKLLSKKQSSLDLILALTKTFELTYEQGAKEVDLFLHYALSHKMIIQC